MSACIRCGKQRIVVSSYEEKIEKSVIITTITACSDPECQKLVDNTLNSEKAKRVSMQAEKERREQQRLEANKRAKALQ